ncbi:DUF2637 domain-containing protein [Glycomyces sp. NPDC049804]|uniref:DUF2637 domain-containing protein n=1 Tax=Glycomyces sp. NPDC049804 TaxID=3154363 RepID=UPI0034149035
MSTPIPTPATPEPERDPQDTIDWDLLDQQVFGDETEPEQGGEDTTCTSDEARTGRAEARIDPPPFAETSDDTDGTEIEAAPTSNSGDEPQKSASMIPSFVDWERAEAEGKVKASRAAASSKIAVADAALERKLRREGAEEERRLRREALEDERKARRRVERKQSRLERKERRRASRAVLVERVRENAVGVYAMTVYATAATVAVGGQISVAAARDWPLMFGIGMAVFIEGTALAMALTAMKQRLKGEKAFLPRALTWLFALFAAGINYYTHAEDQILAVILGASSLTAITVYEIRSAAKHRDALREQEMIAEPATQFGWRIWLVHPRLTFAAWKQDVSARLAGEAANLMGAAVDAAECRSRRRAADAEVDRARREAKQAGFPPIILTFADDTDTKTTEETFAADAHETPAEGNRTDGHVNEMTSGQHTSCTFREKGPADTKRHVAAVEEPTADEAETAAAPRPKRPRPVPAKPMPAPAARLSDDEVIAGLRDLVAAEGGVSVKRARREFGLGFERAKRLIEKAERPDDGTEAGPE